MSFAEARKQAGLTVAEASRKLEVTPAAICQWERGKTVPNARRLPVIAKVYGVTVDDLLKEEEKCENDRTTETS